MGSVFVVDLVLSMNTIVDMVGLSCTFSCTHDKPNCMHSKTSSVEYESLNVGSIKSDGILSFQLLHA